MLALVKMKNPFKISAGRVGDRAGRKPLAVEKNPLGKDIGGGRRSGRGCSLAWCDYCGAALLRRWDLEDLADLDQISRKLIVIDQIAGGDFEFFGNAN